MGIRMTSSWRCDPYSAARVDVSASGHGPLPSSRETTRPSSLCVGGGFCAKITSRRRVKKSRCRCPKSVKHLTVIDSSFNKQFRTIIDVPISTISLRLEDPWDRTPVIGSMPLLAVAFVRLGTDSVESLDRCYNSEYGDCEDEHCEECYGLERDNFNGSTASDAKKNKSVLLKGLSEAKSLVLIDESHKFIFKQDVKWCPMFRMLKTLLLNEYWCVPPDFRELACLLEHSPVLEKLTLQIFSKGPDHKFEIIGSYNQMEGSVAISENLKIVEVKFEVADEGVLKVYDFLRTLNIDFNFDEEEETLVEDVSATN